MPHLSEDFRRVSESRASSALARHVVDEIADCRGGVYKPIARKRWIWELIQNAKDCAKDRAFQFNVSLKRDRLVVWHDARPFTLAEIVCLVEGDSSKPRRSAETTGKYGKGFLVTHVISTDVEVRGVLRHERDGDFSFRFRLRRDGPIGAVLQNIKDCREALDAAQPFNGDVCRTEFVYYVSSREDETRDCLFDTIRALKNHAPYLFAFIPALQRLTVGIEEEELAEFSLCERPVFTALDVPAEAKRVNVNTPEGLRSVLHFTPVNPSDRDRASLAVRLLNKHGTETIVVPTTVARIFQDLPLHATADFGLPVVLNLPRQCDVDSNRAMPDFEKDATADAIKFGLALLPSVVRWALQQNIIGAHRLANVGPAEPLAQNPDAEKRWRSSVIPVVDELRRSKIVTVEAGHPLRPEETNFAGATWLDFPADPQLLMGTRELLAKRGDNVPCTDVAIEWDDILHNWEELQPTSRLYRTTLKDLFSEVQHCKTLAVLQRQRPALTSPENALAYVSRLFEVAAEYCKRHEVEAPTGLSDLPVILAQSGHFVAGATLSIDGGLDNLLKDVSAFLDKPFRSRLVDERLAKSDDSDFIKRLCNNRVYEQSQAVRDLVTLIETRFESKQRGPEAEKTKTAAVQLLVWFAANPAQVAENLRSFPVLCEDQELHIASESGDAFIAPKPLIAADDAAWLWIFPNSVRVADNYVSSAEALGVSVTTLAQFLSQKNIASSTLVFDRQVTSDESFFSGMQDVLRVEAGHRVESLSAKDVAGFTRLLNATGNVSRTGEWNNAQDVMRLVLSRIVVADQSWRSTVSATCNGTHRCSRLVSIFPTAWMGKLRTHPWIPGGSSGCEPLNAKNLDHLLDKIGSELLKEVAARDFLALHFGVNPLDLALRAKAGDDTAQLAELRQQWAGVVELDVAPQVVREIVERHRTASAISTRNNQLGKAVESLVAQALRDQGFIVEPTGVGSDFRAALVEPRDPDWSLEDVGEVVVWPKYGATAFEFLIEVKATCRESVRMSRIQAETASQRPLQYVLCVVDFRGRAEQFNAVMAHENDASIAGCLSLVPDIGLKLVPAVTNLASAEKPATPGIELEKADEIRFRIEQQVWQPGEDLKSWVSALLQSLVLGTDRKGS